ncbi:PREDICTED: transcriptional repressor CTCFL-like [Priapulus caudatus]|uniref:Transcriptional repressor CTCFL-like n=1 Tax=Priapulus caudatus TaxID=37621 RepID=A0ABM1EII2_PRICU|nr:PREDICTED: transcriptional repressor CTCFL-like [Priapulus caudatus]
MDAAEAATGTATPQTLTDIQSYLDTFNKEIQDAPPGSAAAQSGGQMVYVTSGSADTTDQQQVLYVASGTGAESESPDVGGGDGQQQVVFVTTDDQGNIQYTTADGSEYDPSLHEQEQVADLAHFKEESQEMEGATVAGQTQGGEALHDSGISGLVNAATEGIGVQQQGGAQRQQEPMVALQPGAVLEGEHAVLHQDQVGEAGVLVDQSGNVIQSSEASIVNADTAEQGEDDTLQMMANIAEQAQAMGDGQNVILNTGNSYQTVTIVPSDTNPDEVSYVLIVSQPDDKDKDLSVYDFNDEGQAITEQVDADGKKIIRVTPRKGKLAVGQAAHMCNYCNYTSPKRYLLARHMKSHSEERPHKCNICERGFKTVASLQNHLNTHTGTKPHQCKECTSAFTTSGELVRHVRYRHTHEKPHRCTECDYSSVELSKLKRHMRCHTGERPYQCPHCTYASPDTYKLKRHLRIHTGEKPYQCEVCQARFTQSNSLKAHRLIHSGNKPIYQCELCPTTCGRKTDLRIHIQKLHTSDNPIKCKRCGKDFPDRYAYKIHAKTHDGEKCFKCDLCPYASLTQRHLESHMLIHTDQKPFQCEQCVQTFRQKQLLKRHQNLYHNPDYVPPIPREKTHECPECHKLFRHKGNLIRHLALHDPEATTDQQIAAEDLEGEDSMDEDHMVQLVESEHIEPDSSDEDGEEGEARPDLPHTGVDAPPSMPRDMAVSVQPVVTPIRGQRRGRPRKIKIEVNDDEPFDDGDEEYTPTKRKRKEAFFWFLY